MRDFTEEELALLMEGAKERDKSRRLASAEIRAELRDLKYFWAYEIERYLKHLAAIEPLVRQTSKKSADYLDGYFAGQRAGAQEMYENITLSIARRVKGRLSDTIPSKKLTLVVNNALEAEKQG